MWCIRFLLLLLCVYSATANYEETLLQTFKKARAEGSISGECQAALLLYIESLDSDSWAAQMLDSTSKIPVGLKRYNFGEVGQYEECLATESNDGSIQPRYCLVTIPFISATKMPIFNTTDLAAYEKAFRIKQAGRILSNGNDLEVRASAEQPIGINWALCLPTQCSAEDVTTMLSYLIGSPVVYCQTKDDLHKPLTNGAIAMITFLACIAFLMVVSTTIDLYYTFLKKEDSPHILLLAFSVYSNGKKLLVTRKHADDLSCLNGIRLYSMMWVIIGHVHNGASFSPILNLKDMMDWLNTIRSHTIINGTLSVDTFFLLAGTLISYGFIKAKHKEVKFNIFQFYLHRYLRLTPVLAVTVLVTGNLLTYMGNGPRWNFMSTMEETCKKWWWSSILYIQNYVNLEEMCLSQTWYLSVDTQLYMISPLLLIPLWKYPKFGEALASLCVLIFIIVPFCVIYINELPAFVMNPQMDAQKTKDFSRLYYMNTHTRASPWFIGIILGYVLGKIKFLNGFKYLTLNKPVAVLLWVASLGVALTCVYGGHETLMSAEIDVWANSFYVALIRPTWAFSVAVIIYLCVTGNGGIINWFLSLPIYQILNRFTYSIYLLHYPMLLIIAYSEKSGIYFTEISMYYKFWGIIMFSFATSVLWVLAFESPIVVIEKVILGGHKRSSSQENGTKNGVSP